MKIALLFLISFGLCLISMANSAPLNHDINFARSRQNNAGTNASEDVDDDDDDDEQEEYDDDDDEDDDDDDVDDEGESDDDDESEDDEEGEDYLERVLDDFVGDDDDEDDDDEEDDEDDSDVSNASNPQQLPAQVQQDLADPSNIVYDDTEDFAPPEYSPLIDPHEDAVRLPSNSIETSEEVKNTEDDEDDDDDEEEDDGDDDDFISDEAIEARDLSMKKTKKTKKGNNKNKKHV